MHFVILAAVAGACNVILPHENGATISEPETFAPGVISTQNLEYSVTFSPDCKTVYFSRREGDWGSGENTDPILLESHWREGKWSAPKPLPFSGEYGDDDPFLTADGRYLYFTSTRPKTANAQKADYDIWRVERSGAKWGEPERLPEPINSDGTEYSPALGSSGTIYLASDREGGLGQGDVYAARPNGESGYTLEHLPNSINSPLGEWNVGVNAEETVLIFEASQRETNLSSYGDLYISRRDNKEQPWSKAVPLSPLNTTGSNLMPRYTPDEAYLFYGSTDTLQSRDADIKYVSAEAVMGQTRSTEYIAVANRSEHVISLVDSVTYDVVAKIDSGKGPHSVAPIKGGWVSASYGVYNDVKDVNKTPRKLKFKFVPSEGIIHYNLKTKQRTAFSLEDCARPHDLASSPGGSSFWITCEDERSIAEIDTLTGKEKTRWRTQAAGSHMVLYDETRDRLYTGNVDGGSVSIIDRKTGVTKVIKTDRGAEGIAFTPDRSTLWVANTQANTISVIDLNKSELISTFNSNGRFPVQVSITVDGTEAWVTQNNSREVSIFDVNTMDMVQTIPLESVPLGILVSPSGDRMFVSLPRLDRVDVFDIRTKEKIGSFSPGIEPDGLAWVTAD